MPQMLSIEFNLYWTRNIALSLTAVAKLKQQLVLRKILFIRVMLKPIPHMIYSRKKYLPEKSSRVNLHHFGAFNDFKWHK